MTVGTNQPATMSARRWIGARLRCASATIFTMRDSMVSLPTSSARITKLPLTFTVPPITLASTALETGIGSPVMLDSSTEPAPSTIAPSTGTFSPGRTRSRSPTAIRSIATSASLPLVSTRRAVRGASPSSALMAPPVASRARSSRTWPTSTSTTMTAAGSK
jgi:hypothetical protein